MEIKKAIQWILLAFIVIGALLWTDWKAVEEAALRALEPILGIAVLIFVVKWVFKSFR